MMGTRSWIRATVAGTVMKRISLKEKAMSA
jgi:hypothetical protein